MKDAEEIAMLLFPEDWIANTDNPGFKVDNNYGRRRCAEAVAHYFLEVLRRDTTASAVMHAFYRREHRQEPPEKEKTLLRTQMGTALLAYEMQLKEKIPAEGCVHEYGLRLCEQCCGEVNKF
jgi:hypothetical protein